MAKSKWEFTANEIAGSQFFIAISAVDFEAELRIYGEDSPIGGWRKGQGPYEPLEISPNIRGPTVVS